MMGEHTLTAGAVASSDLTNELRQNMAEVADFLDADDQAASDHISEWVRSEIAALDKRLNALEPLVK